MAKCPYCSPPQTLNTYIYQLNPSVSVCLFVNHCGITAPDQVGFHLFLCSVEMPEIWKHLKTFWKVFSSRWGRKFGASIEADCDKEWRKQTLTHVELVTQLSLITSTEETNIRFMSSDEETGTFLTLIHDTNRFPSCFQIFMNHLLSSSSAMV